MEVVMNGKKKTLARSFIPSNAVIPQPAPGEDFFVLKRDRVTYRGETEGATLVIPGQMANLTQHNPSEGQQGVTEPLCLSGLLTFNPEEISRVVVIERAEEIAEHAVGFASAMIGGAPYLMAPLVEALKRRYIIPCFALSKRESVEEVVNGKTVKKSVFRHEGFLAAF